MTRVKNEKDVLLNIGVISYLIIKKAIPLSGIVVVITLLYFKLIGKSGLNWVMIFLSIYLIKTLVDLVGILLEVCLEFILKVIASISKR